MDMFTGTGRALAIVATALLLGCGGASGASDPGAADATGGDGDAVLGDTEPVEAGPSDGALPDQGRPGPTSCAGFRDEFSGATLNMGTWKTVGFSGWNPEIVDGRLTFTPTPAFSGLRTGLVQLRGRFDLTGCSVWVEVARGLPATISGEVNVGLSAANALVRARQGQLQFAMTVGGAPKTEAIPYDPVAHRWWRFREASGVLFMGTSPDGLTWTERFQGAHATSITAVDFQLNIVDGSMSVFDAPQFDNVNAVP